MILMVKPHNWALAALALGASHVYEALPPMPTLHRESPARSRGGLKNPSKYMPHQGKRECARRVRQMAAKLA